tara:strand:- start:690 stop:1289 length:600 start_codon:yes stop_codon:yes gene_type:complete
MLGVNIQAVAEKFNLRLHRCFPRSFDRFLLELYSKGKPRLVGIEIGVYRAEHANFLLKSNKIRFMYLIDEYKLFNDAGVEPVDMDKSKSIAMKRLSKNKGKFKLIMKNSDDAHHQFDNNLVDFVYIDGGHSYEQVKKDINNYFPLVKKGGIIGGHDFNNGDVNQTPTPNGVVKAVMEFVHNNGYCDRLFINDYNWWFIK